MSGRASGEAVSEFFTNPLTASPLVFTASLPKQKHSRAKSRKLRRLFLLRKSVVFSLPSEGCKSHHTPDFKL